MSRPTFAKLVRREAYNIENGTHGAFPAQPRIRIFNPNKNGKPESTLVSPGQIINWRKLWKRQQRKSKRS